MTLVTIECPRCGGSTRMRATDLLVEVDGPDPVDDRMGGTAAWVCLGCDELVLAPVSWSDLISLVTAGAHLLDAGVPDSVPAQHPEHPAAGRPLTPDDLLDLHALLEEPGWFDQLTSVSAASEYPS